MSMRSRLMVAISLLALSGGDAFAGVLITSTSTPPNLKPSNTQIQTLIYADTDKLKIVSEPFIIIYRGDLKKYWTISPVLKVYPEMTPESLNQSAERAAAEQAAIQQQIAKMTPQQRQEMQAVLSKLPPGMTGMGMPLAGAGRDGSAAQTSQVTYAKAGGPTKTVASLPCEPYRKTTSSRMINGEMIEDVCIARISAAGLTAADFKVMDSMNA